MRELREITGGGLVAGGNKTFNPIIEPVGRQVLLVSDGKSPSTSFVASRELKASTITVPPNRQISPTTPCLPSSSDKLPSAARIVSRERVGPDVGSVAIMSAEITTDNYAFPHSP